MERKRDFIKDLIKNNTQFYRKVIQYGFLMTIILIGAKFAIFVKQLESSLPLTVSRPPGIESFLPISSLISLKFWLVSGVFNRIHPSGLIIFIIILGTAIFLKRGFCSWVCPFGLLTEYLNRIHRIIFRKDLKVPRWLDYPLRSLKYLLLFYFLWVIGVKMDSFSLEYFIYSPYNMVADIKMLHFFTNISAFAFWTLLILFGLSIVLRNFWCRYLCPYGALLGVLSFLSLLKVHRHVETCTQCRKCTRVCPVDIQVHSTKTVLSDECHACLKCVSVCPEERTLYLSVFYNRFLVKPLAYVLLIAFFFIGGSALGRVAGYWQNEISVNEYTFHVSHLDLPFYQHRRGQIAEYNMEAWLRMMERIREGGMQKSEG